MVGSSKSKRIRNLVASYKIFCQEGIIRVRINIEWTGILYQNKTKIKTALNPPPPSSFSPPVELTRFMMWGRYIVEMIIIINAQLFARVAFIEKRARESGMGDLLCKATKFFYSSYSSYTYINTYSGAYRGGVKGLINSTPHKLTVYTFSISFIKPTF